MIHAYTPPTDDVRSWLEERFPEGDVAAAHSESCERSSCGDECQGGCPVVDIVTPAIASAETQAAMAQAGRAVRESAELQRLFEALKAAHAPGQENGAWDTPAGHRIERVLGHLQMALDAAGVQL